MVFSLCVKDQGAGEKDMGEYGVAYIVLKNKSNVSCLCQPGVHNFSVLFSLTQNGSPGDKLPRVPALLLLEILDHPPGSDT